MSAKDVVATMTSLAQIHVITSQYVETTPCIDNSLRPYGSGLYDLESLKTKCTAFCELVAQPGSVFIRNHFRIPDHMGHIMYCEYRRSMYGGNGTAAS